MEDSSEDLNVEEFTENQIISLQKYFADNKFRENRINKWQEFFCKYELTSQLPDSSDDDESVPDDSPSPPKTRQKSKRVKPDLETHSKPLTKEPSTPKRRSKTIGRFSLQSQLRKCVLTPESEPESGKKRKLSLKDDNSFSKKPNRDVDKCAEENNENVVPTSSDDLEKKRLVYLIEEKLQSDLNVRLFKRYRAQIEKNEENLSYWEDSTMKEMKRLVYELVSTDDLRAYMKLSLLSSISEMKSS